MKLDARILNFEIPIITASICLNLSEKYDIHRMPDDG